MSVADRLLDAMASASRQYGGEPVTELAHSLQCADLAEQAGADEGLVLACLLHDVGRVAVDPALVRDRAADAVPVGAAARGHHEVGAELIAPYVPERVAWLVRMHAAAKRYLCATEPGYHDRLTPVSRYTLEIQGGVMSPAEVAALAGHPWLPAALALRRWDDQAKVPGKATRPLAAWAPLLRRHFTAPRAGSA